MSDTQKQKAADWFATLQMQICNEFEQLEREADTGYYIGEPATFEFEDWKRGDGSEDLGGGRAGMLRGRLFEKVGVHICCPRRIHKRLRRSNPRRRRRSEILGGGYKLNRSFKKPQNSCCSHEHPVYRHDKGLVRRWRRFNADVG